MESIFLHESREPGGEWCWLLVQLPSAEIAVAGRQPPIPTMWTVELWHCGHGVASVYIE